jgi:3-deoxy-D-manno-octulosonic-acid transferase
LYLLYSACLTVAFVLAVPFYLWKGRGTGKYLSNFRERLGRLPAGLEARGRASIWIHAVSVGEVLAARTLIAPLKRRFPDLNVFVSTTTLTGQAIARRSVTDSDGLFYAPFDFRHSVRRVLGVLQPRLLVLVETEIWPNLIHEARRRGARIAIVNGRLSPRSFGRYRRIRVFLAPVLAEIDLFAMQGEPHADRVRALGAPPGRVHALGNLKFDALEAPQPSAPLRRLFSGVGDRLVWVAGSTVPGEEEQVVAAFRSIQDALPDAALVIAPRHPERFGQVSPVVTAAGLRAVRRSTLGDGAWDPGDVLILDSLGELAQVYCFATVVFVGGSLAPAGGHNVLEPAVAGKAVVVGPHMENFQEIADQFLAEQALVQVDSAAALAHETLTLLRDASRREALGERARNLTSRNRGALARTLDALAELVA